MAQFEKLQELWQGQAGPPFSAADIAALTRSLRRLCTAPEVDRRRERCWLVSPSWDGRSRAATSPIRSPVCCWWRGGGRVVDARVAEPAARSRGWISPRLRCGFVEGAIDRLNAQRNPFAPASTGRSSATVVVSMNLMLSDSSHRIWVRVLASALPFGACEFGLWFRRKRLERSNAGRSWNSSPPCRAALEERFE